MTTEPSHRVNLPSRPGLLLLTALLVVGSLAGLAAAAASSGSALGPDHAHPGVFLGYNVTFAETGLPRGDTWDVTFNSILYTSTTATLVISEVANNTYAYNLSLTDDYAPTPISGHVTVNGGNPTPVAITFVASPNHFTVTFTEDGLPATATSWNITFNNTLYVSNAVGGFTGAPEIVITGVVNGTYSYSTAPQYGLYPSPTAGGLTVVGASTTRGGYGQEITFGPPQGHYAVEFRETGLAAGDVWHLSFNTTGTLAVYYAVVGAGFGGGGAATTITIDNVVNGTYAWNTTYTGYAATPSSGSLPVSGGAAETRITFGPPPGHYTVEFTETGLPAGTAFWNLTFNGTPIQGTVAAFGISEITINDVVNGTYAFSVGDDVGCIPAPAAGSVVVNGPATGAGGYTTPITFSCQTVGEVQLWFNETGLPTGTLWTVAGSGTLGTQSQTTADIEFFAGEGHYTFTVGTIAGWKATPATGDLTVDHTTIATPIVFTQVLAYRYTTNFTETGLPAGTSWSLTYNNTLLGPSTDAWILAPGAPNGTYAFSITSLEGWTASPAAGSVVISGQDETEAITFSPAYTATFSESGLVSGTSWEVFLPTTHLTGTESDLVFTDLAPSTYAFTVQAVSGYSASPSSGNLVVSGDTTQAIKFTPTVQPTYEVAFAESGLPSGTNWSVVFNGATKGSVTSTIDFYTMNGSDLSYSVNAVSGYSASPSSGTLSVAGASPSVTAITFTSTSSSSKTTSNNALGTGLSGLELAAILAVVVIAAVVAVAFVLLRRKKGSPPSSATMEAAPVAGAAAGAGSSWASSYDHSQDLPPSSGAPTEEPVHVSSDDVPSGAPASSDDIPSSSAPPSSDDIQ